MTDAIALDEAYKRGDVAAVKAALGDPPGFPNCQCPPGFSKTCLEYAIHHAPLAFIAALLDLGADPNARTKIDDYATPLEEAEMLGHAEAAAALRKHVPG